MTIFAYYRQPTPCSTDVAKQQRSIVFAKYFFAAITEIQKY